MGHLQDLIRENNINFIGIIKTIKQDLFVGMLKGMCGHKNVSWNWLPPSARSRGILVGINNEKMNILKVSMGMIHVKLEVQNVGNKLKWDLLVVYEAAQNEFKEEFLAEMATQLQKQKYSLLMGGDFIIIRKEGVKNIAGGYNKSSFIFNAIIEQANLRE